MLSHDFERMGGGDRVEVAVAGGATFVVTYREDPAYGDDGSPAPGDVTGEYYLHRGALAEPADWTLLAQVHVAPHGTGPYGNPYAKGYSAQRVADALGREVERRRPNQRTSRPEALSSG